MNIFLCSLPEGEINSKVSMSSLSFVILITFRLRRRDSSTVNLPSIFSRGDTINKRKLAFSNFFYNFINLMVKYLIGKRLEGKGGGHGLTKFTNFRIN